VNDPPDTFADPQVRAREMLVEMEDPRLGTTVRQAGIAIKLSDTPGEIRRLGPVPGEHGDEILAALGYGADERRRLRDAGVTG
jgi:crotonobetainyl-CoA:carnitine CoA-transferase CaiB-like acyl-CoA transferase